MKENLLPWENAVVTGASYGIGRAMAIGFARKGCNLILIGRNKKGLEETAERVRKEGRKVKVFALDLTNYNDLRKIFNQVNNVSVLYNGVANWVEKKLIQVSPKEIEETVDAVYKANIFATKFFLPFLIKSKGAIINMVSDWGLPDAKAPSLFGSAKNALSIFGSLLREELKDKRVRIINVYPAEVSSSLDIDNPTQEDKKIRLSDLISAILRVFDSERENVKNIMVSNLTNKLNVKYL